MGSMDDAKFAKQRTSCCRRFAVDQVVYCVSLLSSFALRPRYMYGVLLLSSFALCLIRPRTAACGILLPSFCLYTMALLRCVVWWGARCAAAGMLL